LVGYFYQYTIIQLVATLLDFTGYWVPPVHKLQLSAQCSVLLIVDLMDLTCSLLIMDLLSVVAPRGRSPVMVSGGFLVF
jgi:hypothetical protein